MDYHFNLHLRDLAIKENLIIYKSTKDGMVTSLSCHGEWGKLLVQFFFCKRKTGYP
ncbi:MAG: hypothetical protein ABI045_05755 [Flavobacteriales bacterium]